MIVQLQQQLAMLQASNATTLAMHTMQTTSPSLQEETTTKQLKEKLPTLQTYSGQRYEWEEFSQAGLSKMQQMGRPLEPPMTNSHTYTHSWTGILPKQLGLS